MKISYTIGIFLLLSLIVVSARADVVVVMGAGSSVDALDKNQVASIFLGKASSFPDGSKAIPMDLKEGSAERDSFYKKVTGKSGNQLKSYWSKLVFSGKGQPPKQLADSSEIKKSLAANPNQISYIAKDAVDDTVKVILAP